MSYMLYELYVICYMLYVNRCEMLDTIWLIKLFDKPQKCINYYLILNSSCEILRIHFINN